MSIPRTSTLGRRTLQVALPALCLAVAAAASSYPRSPVYTGIDLADACPEGRWIGVLEAPPEPVTERPEPSRKPRTDRKRKGKRSAGEPRVGGPLAGGPLAGEPLSCPDGWRWLFATREQPVPPPGLQRFCRPGEEEAQPTLKAEWRRIDRGRLIFGPPRPEGEFRHPEDPAVPKWPRFERIDRVCRVVGPAAPSFFPWQDFAGRLQARFDREAGALGGAITPGGPRVRLVVVDSVADDAERPQDRPCEPAARGDLECSPHGWALVRLARRLLCDGGDCVADVDTRRTLHYTYLIQDMGSSPEERRLAGGDPGGGLYGDWQDLALAIRREVADWWATPQRPRLILNLSVGWESFYGDAPAVRAAIVDAVCRGALVVAAAGNRVAGPAFLETPLLPAAWETVPAPTPGECAAALEVPPPGGPVATSYRPLVHAVGGVQRDDRPLSNSRPGATPRLAAFGDHASVPDRNRIPVTLTGTSVSAAVVSAAAAARWSARPDLSSFDVMAALFDAGKDLGRRADFCLETESPCPNVRRVFVRPPASFLTSPWPGDERPILRTDPRDLGIRIAASELTTLAALPGCDPEAFRFGEAPDGGPVLCPQRQLFDVAVQPWLGPTPGSNHNPNCTESTGSPGVLLLEFDRCYRVRGMPVRLADLTLVLGKVAYRLRNLEFVTGDPDRPCPSDPDERDRVQVTVTDLPGDDPYPIYLTVSLDKEQAALAPILHVSYD